MQSQRHGILPMILGIVLTGASCTRPPDAALLEWAAAPVEAFSRGMETSLRGLKDAADDLPLSPHVIPASSRCAFSDDGKLNCREAAIHACKAQGYGTGEAAGTATINACRPTSLRDVWSGDSPSCRTKYQLTAALCW